MSLDLSDKGFVYSCTRRSETSAGVPADKASGGLEPAGPIIHGSPKVSPSASISGPSVTAESLTHYKQSMYDADTMFRSLSPAFGDFAYMPPRHRVLFDHFLAKMAPSISCHPTVQNDMCSTLVPMAASTPHLLAAIIHLGACHRHSLGLDTSLTEVEHLRLISVRRLRIALAASGETCSRETTIAATLVLCMADIVSGGSRPHAWRIHFEGAMSQLAQWTSTSNTITSMTSFLKRFYTSIQSIAFAFSKFRYHNPPGFSEHDGIPSTAYIDDLSGFSTSLLPVFEEINLLNIKKRYSTQDMTDNLGNTGLPDLQEESCQLLIESVHRMLSSRKQEFRPGIEELFSPKIQRDLFSLDEAYHYMALLLLYERARWKVSDDVILNSARRIVSCVSQLSIIDPPCPAVAALPPLFVSGCHMRDDHDREVILDILHQMESHFGMGNVRSARTLLKKVWAINDENDSDNRQSSWNLLSGIVIMKNAP